LKRGGRMKRTTTIVTEYDKEGKITKKIETVVEDDIRPVDLHRKIDQQKYIDAIKMQQAFPYIDLSKLYC